jgi:hypothetical protein
MSKQPRIAKACMMVMCAIMFMAGIGNGAEGGKDDAIKVTAKELGDAYKENAVAANMKYKNKVVEVTGTIHSIMEKFIELESFDCVDIYLDTKNEEKAAALKKGEKVTFRGTVTGKGAFSVYVKKADVVK